MTRGATARIMRSPHRLSKMATLVMVLIVSKQVQEFHRAPVRLALQICARVGGMVVVLEETNSRKAPVRPAPQTCVGVVGMAVVLVGSRMVIRIAVSPRSPKGAARMIAAFWWARPH